MTGRTWLLIDVSCLAYRAFYSTGDLSHEGVATGAVFGLFKATQDLMELHGTDRLAWAFDRGHDKRSELCPTYKANRRQERSEEEAEALRGLRRQLYKLRTDYLPSMGFRNVLWWDGYEADDVIASVCGTLPDGDRAVIISTDGDLWQLLGERVSVWIPTKGRPVTAESFTREWGVSPSQWADVKAIAGCSGDNVEGIRGVGEKTAAKFLGGTLKDTTKAFRAIVEGDAVWRRNLELVRLPMAGVGRFRLRDDDVGPGDWDRMFGRLGMKSLRGRAFGGRKYV